MNEEYNVLWKTFSIFLFEKEIIFKKIDKNYVYSNKDFLDMTGFLQENPEYYELFMKDTLNILESSDIYKASIVTIYLSAMAEQGVPFGEESVKLLDFFLKITDMAINFINSSIARSNPAPVLEEKTLNEDNKEDKEEKIEILEDSKNKQEENTEDKKMASNENEKKENINNSQEIAENTTKKIENKEQVNMESPLLETPKQAFTRDPENYKALEGSGEIVVAIMSFICRDRGLRSLLRKAPSFPEKCSFISEYKKEYNFIWSVLCMCENEKIYFISPKYKKGFETTVFQIDSNFVLFTLFQRKMLENNFLENLGVKEQDLTDPGVAFFDYYTYKAYKAGGTFEITRQGDSGKKQVIPERFVWGEGNVYEIPRLEGKIIVLIAEPTLKRSWGENFTRAIHPALTPELQLVKELSEREVDDLLKNILKAEGELKLVTPQREENPKVKLLQSKLTTLEGFKLLFPGLFSGGKAKKSFEIYNSATKKGVYEAINLRKVKQDGTSCAILAFNIKELLSPEEKLILTERANKLSFDFIKEEAVAYQKLQEWTPVSSSQVLAIANDMDDVLVFAVVTTAKKPDFSIIVYAEKDGIKHIYPVPNGDL